MVRWRNDTSSDLFAPTTGETFPAGEEFDLDPDVYVHVVGLTRLDDEPKPKRAAKAASAPSGEEPTE